MQQIESRLQHLPQAIDGKLNASIGHSSNEIIALCNWVGQLFHQKTPADQPYSSLYF